MPTEAMLAGALTAYVATPLLQAFISHLGSDSYQTFRGWMSSLSKRLRRQPRELQGTWQITVFLARNQYRVELPGDLPEIAHQGLVRDFERLMAESDEQFPLRIVWNTAKQEWVKKPEPGPRRRPAGQ
ncbi:hypothetical protein ACFYOF_20780 [Streptomyces sp. NPDC007148]|uniref:hypothetical protein n=1 Tax=Streptomyces sp. NPDC007148 TaxID=3364775 RepID=UPI0036C92BFF